MEEQSGSPTRFVADSGASLVFLTPEDAQNAGISRSELVYNQGRAHRQRDRPHRAGDAPRDPHR